MNVLLSPRGKHELELDQAAHGVHVVPQRQAELVFGVALSLQREHHVSHRWAAPAHAAEALPQAQRHAPQRILHKGLALAGGEGGEGGGLSLMTQWLWQSTAPMLITWLPKHPVRHSVMIIQQP